MILILALFYLFATPAFRGGLPSPCQFDACASGHLRRRTIRKYPAPASTLSQRL
jgi:hypothetical protein